MKKIEEDWVEVSVNEADRLISSFFADASRLCFFTPPECQGQIVIYSYASCGEYLIRMCVDLSDRTTSYAARLLREEDDPINVEPD